ncbi:FAD-dependent oxidoreductase [Paenibacillus piscarius]|uniref:FAD-dependent oxidoreductase n=1 Tax=Paenibacillus piscarius TaxID=1089681 RepID=UPI001EE952D1|nr:FAD-dependent oxidoreductase [Paenibacillus piscarius]
MGFFQDNLIPIFKKRELLFQESYKEAENVFSFVFEKEKDMTWKAGQYGLFSITHKKIKNPTKPFSLSSSPTENVIKITTVIPDEPSDFKKALLELKKGSKVSMSGPLGPFYLKDNRPALLVAGGIGITPFRSIVKRLSDESSGFGNKVHLLYMDSQQSFLFKNEWDEISKQASLNVNYLTSRDELYLKINEFLTSYKDEANYFIAGPKSMTDSISTHLLNQNVHKKNITKDVFTGY